MSNLFNLIKVSFINNLGVNKIINKKTRKRKLPFIFLFILVTLLIFGFVGFYIYSVAEELNDFFGPEIILTICLLLVAGMLVISTLSKANSYLFKSNDLGMLLSLPVNSKTIVLSKILSFLLYNYVLISFIYIPMIIVYALFAQTTVLFWILAVIIYLVLPLLVISIFSFISYVLSYIFMNFKYKNILAILLYIAILVVIMSVNFSFQEGAAQGDLSSMLEGFNNRLKWMYYPAYLAREALTGYTINILFLILINVIPFIAFILITSKVYVKANSRLTSTGKKRKFNVEKLDKKRSGSITTLLKFETKRFFSIPTYVLNSVASKVLAIVFAILVTSQIKEVDNQLGSNIIILISVAAILFILGTNTSTSASISIEGNRLWILKSSPVKVKDIFTSKILLDFILSVVAIIPSVSIIYLMIGGDVALYLLALVVLLLFALHNSMLGLIINLKFPKLDWDLPIKAVKQSLSVILTIFIGMLLEVIILFAGYKVFAGTLDIMLTFITALSINLAFVLIELFILGRFGEKLFNKLSA